MELDNNELKPIFDKMIIKLTYTHDKIGITVASEPSNISDEVLQSYIRYIINMVANNLNNSFKTT